MRTTNFFFIKSLLTFFIIFMTTSNAEANTPSKVQFTTNYGNIVIQLYTEKAPISSQNFIDYVNDKFFDGTVFHRVIPDFMIQGGGFDEEMQQKKTKKPIKNEAKNGLKNKVGTLSMARTQDINSATSQFFINLKDNAFLDHSDRDYGYAVFGEVIKGMETVKKIADVETTNKLPHQNVPVEDVVILKAELID